MVKTILCKAIQSDEDFSVHTGKWFDLKDVNHIVDYDADVWGQDRDGSIRLLAKFRRNVFSTDTVKLGWECFRGAGKQTRGRAAAAGPVDLSGAYWAKRNVASAEGYNVQYYRTDGTVSKMKVQNPVSSGTVGFFERTTFLRLPCRLTTYTRRNFQKFMSGIPFITAIDTQFKNLIPLNHAAQYEAACMRPDFQIGTTAFSTLTVNMNFRTALHKDSGDFDEGFGNLTVIEYGKYRGGETLFPRYRIGFDVRTGDFLAMNVHEYHCNARIWTTPEDDAYNLTLPDIRKSKTQSESIGVAGADARYGRLTFVCYLRKKIRDCDPTITKKYYENIGFNERIVHVQTGGDTDDDTGSIKSNSAKVCTSAPKN